MAKLLFREARGAPVQLLILPCDCIGIALDTARAQPRASKCNTPTMLLEVAVMQVAILPGREFNDDVSRAKNARSGPADRGRPATH